ncbi:MAG: glycosyltransferase family 4 protein [Deltaproteobacteria bacterium]|nr:glycosyltransferase family 4 protein [Deltaproteobacteria bacterium]
MRKGNIRKMASSKIKVIQVLPELEEGGVEKGTLELSDYLVQNGHNSIVISAGGQMVKSLQEQGGLHITYKYIPEKTPRALIHIPGIRNIILKEKPDILHLRSRLPAWIAYFAYKSLPKKKRPKLITTFHGFYSINKYSAIMTKADKIIAVSNIIAKHIKKEYGIAENKIRIIHRGVDNKYLNTDKIEKERLESLKKKWKIKEQHTPLILLPARLTRLKGHDLFIKSLSLISELKWKAIFAGGIPANSNYVNQLKEKIEKLKLAQRILFAGHCSDMPAAIALSDIVISASVKPESFGRTIIEAQAAKKAVIAPAFGGSLETIKDNYTGWLFKPQNAESLAKVLKDALLNKEKREKLGKQAKEQIKKNFTTQKMCQSTVELYKELIDN